LAKPRRPLSESLPVHDQVYASLRDAILTGRFEPGRGVSLRTLAADLGVSPMPVRDAVRRLVAEQALVINQANKRLATPSLTPDRVEQLTLAREWIEPELAARAARQPDPELAATLRRLDADVDAAIARADVQGYMAANHAFHFRLYERAGAEVLLAVAASLWLQTGPFMRVVFNRLGPSNLTEDNHGAVAAAVAAGDPDAARAALAADIDVGMRALQAAAAEDRPAGGPA